jgi:hypothetical protein
MRKEALCLAVRTLAVFAAAAVSTVRAGGA